MISLNDGTDNGCGASPVIQCSISPNTYREHREI
uniref:Uncharacterized protein n=1 Tax=Arundo donax TaxID=35708 RepID=A0A0A8ZBQ2_ARUDO